MNTTDTATVEAFGLASFQERAEAMLSRVFRGIHHVHNLKRGHGMWTCLHYGDLSTFDSDILTRLVLASHEYCIRASIQNGGPRTLKIILHPRTSRDGNYFDRHPTIEQAIERFAS